MRAPCAPKWRRGVIIYPVILWCWSPSPRALAASLNGLFTQLRLRSTHVFHLRSSASGVKYFIARSFNSRYFRQEKSGYTAPTKCRAICLGGKACQGMHAEFFGATKCIHSQPSGRKSRQRVGMLQLIFKDKFFSLAFVWIFQSRRSSPTQLAVP